MCLSPTDKLLDLPKLKTYEHDKLNVNHVTNFVCNHEREENIAGKYWLIAFSPFPTMFFYVPPRVYRSRDCMPQG